MYRLELKSVQRRVSSAFRLRSISLRLSGGECLALVGPSGSGKTTLLRVIAGLEPLDAGSIRVDGSIVAQAGRTLPPYARGIGLVFQSLALWPHMTVERHVYYGIPGKISRSERTHRTRALMARLGLEPLAKRFPAQLSGGERQRVALARALVAEPRILLLDEPLASLDRGLRGEVLGILRALKREREISLIYVSHDRDEIRAIAEHGVVLEDGSVVEAGPAGYLLDHPKTAAASRVLAPVLLP